MGYNKLNIKFNSKHIQYWADKFSFQAEDKVLALDKNVRTQKCLTKSDLKIVGEWKSPRSVGKICNNRESCVEEVTRFALNTSCGQGNHREFDNFGRCRTVNRIRHPSFLSRKGLPDLGLSRALVGFSEQR